MKRLALASAPLALLLTGAGIAQTIEGDSLNDRVAEQQAALAAARQQSAQAERQAAVQSRAASAARTEAERDRSELAALGLRIQSAEADLAAAQARFAIIEELERAQLRRLAAQQRPLSELMATLQLLTRRPPIALFAQPGATSDMVHSRAMIEAVLPQINARTGALRNELARSRELRQARERMVADLASTRSRLADRRAALATSASQARLRAAVFNSAAGMEADRAIALAQDAGDIGDLLGRLELASQVRDRLVLLAGPVARPGSVRADSAATGDARPAPLADPVYQLPVAGSVERGLGELDAVGSRARGLTLVTQPGAQVLAPSDGQVVFAGPFRSFGRVVIIDHGGGWTSMIAGMVAVSVRVGDRLSQGSPVGRAGPGRPRITVELRRNGQPMDIATLVS